MKKSLFLIVLILIFSVNLFSQNSFSDVPKDHWAYDAVEKLAEKGIVEGYPDKTFKGKRTLSRYEYAVIIARILPYITDNDINFKDLALKKDLDEYVKESNIPVYNLPYIPGKNELETIKKLVLEFQNELSALGVDVNTVKNNISILNDKVSTIEEEQKRVEITGSFTVASRYLFGANADTIIDIDKLTQNADSQGVKIAKDFQVNIKGKINNNINAYLTLVAGDYIKKNIEAKNTWETTVNTSPDLTIIPYYMYADIDSNTLGNIKIGRLPMQLNKFVFKKGDVDSYTDIARLDDGNYQFDGIDIKKDFGAFDVRAWLGQPQNKEYFDITMFTAGRYPTFTLGLQTPIKTMAGATLGYKIKGARVEALYNYNEAMVNFENCPSVDETGLKNAKVFGGDFTVPMGSFNIDGAFFRQETVKFDDKDKADLKSLDVAFNEGKTTIKVGYKDVKKGFITPSRWESLAYIKGPDNIKGFSLNGAYNFGIVDIFGNYKDYKDKDEDWLGKAVGDIFENNKIKYWNGGLNAKIGSMGKLSLTYENLNNHGAKSDYWTFTWNKPFGNNLFKFGVQRINNDYNDTKGNMIFGQTTFNF